MMEQTKIVMGECDSICLDYLGFCLIRQQLNICEQKICPYKKVRVNGGKLKP